MERLAILGSTGSIGVQTIDVARWHGLKVVALAAGRNAALLVRQAHELKPKIVACHEAVAAEVRDNLPSGTRLVVGAAGLEEVATAEADVVVAAVPGIAGLAPTAAALRAGRHVALANKEAMVVAGPLMWQLAREHGARITPVDSEHSALYQCLVGEDVDEVSALVLTASGGPFREGPADLSRVTPEQALAHPNWSMGPKVTVDSATLFNKGLEVLEAHYLFELPLDRIEVVVHPQSLVHGLVRFRDGNIKAAVGPHDMRLPIQYAVTGSRRPSTPLPPLPLRGDWTFEEPDHQRFPSLRLAYAAGAAGGVAPAYLNAADEVAVAAFLAGRLAFDGIANVLASVLQAAPSAALTWDNIHAADLEARRMAKRHALLVAS
ncbi:MAG TPA: 1-deoxy-D-xylulose-5-phosphate reductoisomerase [Trueperaceae bacterium]|nr:1-deoxy-D-xylulose-5-phosphate reductoisomerase [Trueperaceae bacterium]